MQHFIVNTMPSVQLFKLMLVAGLNSILFKAVFITIQKLKEGKVKVHSGRTTRNLMISIGTFCQYCTDVNLQAII